MANNKTKNAARNAFWGVAGQLTTRILAFVMRTVLLHTLGSDYLGFNSLFVSILQILSMAELGIGSAIIFSMYKPVAEKDTKTVCALLQLNRNLYRIIGLIVLCIGLAIMPFLRHLIAGEISAKVNIYFLYAIYLANSVSSYLFFAYRSSVLVVNQRADIPNIVALLSEIAKSVVQIIILFTVKNYYCYVITIPVTSILCNMVTAYLAKRYYPQYVCAGKVSDELRKKIKEKVMALFGVKITSLIYNSVDSVVISMFIGLTALAQYNNYYYIMQTIIAIVAAIYGSMQAIVGNSIVTETKQKNYADFLNLTFINAWLVGWCTVCLYCLYQPFMTLWMGKELLFENGIMICFCIYFYVFQLKAVQSTYKDAAGLWKEDLYRSYASNIVNLVLNIILVQFIGVYGIILSTVFALLCVSYPWQTKMIHDKLFCCSMRPYIFRLLYYALVTLLACAATQYVCNFVQLNTFSGLFIRAGICCVVPNILFLLLFVRLKEFGAFTSYVTKLLKRG